MKIKIIIEAETERNLLTQPEVNRIYENLETALWIKEAIVARDIQLSQGGII